MAITNAQQYKQLVNKPANGKRPGYRGSDYGDQAAGRGAYSGGPPGNSGDGSTDRSRTSARQDYITAIATGKNPLGLDLDKGPPDLTSQEKKFVKDNASFVETLKNKNYQGSINRNKYLALQKTGLIPGGGFKGFAGSLFDGMTGKVPDNLQDLTEEELTELAFEVQKFNDAGGPINQATYNYNLNPTKKGSGSELLGRTFDAQDLLDNDLMTQSKYEELFPGPTLPKDEGSGDPCKGPNPPAYCFTGLRSAEAATPEVEEEDEIVNYRLMADGGRAGFAEGGMPYEGGIMDLESSRQMYGLGKLVKKITRGVKKIAKSPIGKAALGFAAYKLGGGFLKNKGIMGSIFGTKGIGMDGGTLGLLGKAKLTGGFGSYMPTALGGIAATTLGSYFMTPEEEEEQKLASLGADIADPSYIMNNPSLYTNRRLAAEGGSMDEPVAKKTMPLLDMDGKEMDLREEGGFVPLGRMERADDVPARLSKNEFVFTADAVRNAGEGDVDKGAEVMYNMMKNLESGGDVSEESQGLEGARDMFQTSQRLEEVI